MMTDEIPLAFKIMRNVKVKSITILLLVRNEFELWMSFMILSRFMRTEVAFNYIISWPDFHMLNGLTSRSKVQSKSNMKLCGIFSGVKIFRPYMNGIVKAKVKESM